MEEEVIKIEDILHALRNRWKLIVVITLSVTFISAIFSFYIIKPEYEATTKVFIGKEQSENSSDYSNNDIQMYQKLMKTYGEVIKTKDLINAALETSGIFLETNDVLNNLAVTTNTDTQILEISYTSTDPYEANNVLQAITDTFMIDAKLLIPNGNVQVIEAVQIPQTPVSPNKKMNIAIAFVLGLMISVGLVFLLEYLDNSFKNKDDLEKALDIPVLGTIPLTDVK